MHKTTAIFLIALLVTVSLAGCGENKEKMKTDFNDLIGSTATAENICEAAEFLNANITRAGEETATDMVIAYRDYLLNYIIQNKDKTTIQELSVYIDGETDQISEDKIKNSELKTYYDQITTGSLMVVIYEKLPVLKVDHAKLLERYGKYISHSVQELYGLEVLLNEKPTSENAALTVSFEELINRTYEAEKLLKDHHEDYRIAEDALWIFTSHLNILLMGTTNSPVFDYTTKVFSLVAKDAYQGFMLQEPDSVLSWVLNEYFTYLYSINYQLDFNNSAMSKVFFDTCDWLVSEAEKRVNN
jgi:hypothetical protein